MKAGGCGSAGCEYETTVYNDIRFFFGSIAPHRKTAVSTVFFNQALKGHHLAKKRVAYSGQSDFFSLFSLGRSVIEK
jgi:hypothetical protein